MHSLKLNETLLYDISKRYRDNDSVAEKCQKIISKIEAKNKESSEWIFKDIKSQNKI